MVAVVFENPKTKVAATLVPSSCEAPLQEQFRRCAKLGSHGLGFLVASRVCIDQALVPHRSYQLCFACCDVFSQGFTSSRDVVTAVEAQNPLSTVLTQ